MSSMQTRSCQNTMFVSEIKDSQSPPTKRKETHSKDAVSDDFDEPKQYHERSNSDSSKSTSTDNELEDSSKNAAAPPSEDSKQGTAKLTDLIKEIQAISENFDYIVQHSLEAPTLIVIYKGRWDATGKQFRCRTSFAANRFLHLYTIFSH